jgi:hypothetical protein
VHSISASATDAAGTSASTPSATNVTVDKTLPIVTITAPLTKAIAPNIASIDGKATEAYLSKVDVKLQRKVGTTVQYWGSRSGTLGWGTDVLTVPATLGGAAPNRTWSVPAASLPTGTNLVDGEHTITATATDAAGNSAATATATTVTIDKTAPTTVVITTPAQGSSLTSLTKVAGTATDNTGGSGLARVDVFLRRGAAGSYQYWALRGTGTTAAYRWGSSVTPMTTTLSGTGWSRTTDWPSGADLPATTYTVQATAYDKAGNSLNATEVTFSVTATATASTSATQSQPLTATATASEPEVASSVMLSNASATAPTTVELLFTGAIDGVSSLDATRYSVSVGGQPIVIQSAQLKGTSAVVLGLEENSLKVGDVVTVAYDLKDAKGLRLQGTARAAAR